MQEDLGLDSGAIASLGDFLIPALDMVTLNRTKSKYVRAGNMARKAGESAMMRMYIEAWAATQMYRTRLQNACFETCAEVMEELTALMQTMRAATDADVMITTADKLKTVSRRLKMAAQREGAQNDSLDLLTPVSMGCIPQKGNGQNVTSALKYMLDDQLQDMHIWSKCVTCGDEYTFKLKEGFYDVKYSDLIGRTTNGSPIVRLVKGVQVVADCTVQVQLTARCAARLGDMCTPWENAYKLHFDQLIVGVETMLFQLQPDNQLVPYTPTQLYRAVAMCMEKKVGRLDDWMATLTKIECPTGEPAFYVTCTAHVYQLCQLALSPIMLLADDINMELWREEKILTPTGELRVLDKDDEIFPHGYTQTKFTNFVRDGIACDVLVFFLRV